MPVFFFIRRFGLGPQLAISGACWLPKILAKVLFWSKSCARIGVWVWLVDDHKASVLDRSLSFRLSGCLRGTKSKGVFAYDFMSLNEIFDWQIWAFWSNTLKMLTFLAIAQTEIYSR